MTHKAWYLSSAVIVYALLSCAAAKAAESSNNTSTYDEYMEVAFVTMNLQEKFALSTNDLDTLMDEWIKNGNLKITLKSKKDHTKSLTYIASSKVSPTKDALKPLLEEKLQEMYDKGSILPERKKNVISSDE